MAAAAAGGGGDSRAGPAIVEAGSASKAVQDFWRTVGEAKFEPEDECGGKFLNLESAIWFGKPKSLDHLMYVRKCYPELWGSILESSAAGTSRFGILGSPGVGKTVMGLYILRELQRKGNTVVYQGKKQDPVCKFGWDSNGGAHVWEAETVYPFRRDLDEATTWYIADGVEPSTATAKTVLVTSPDPTVHKKFLQSEGLTLYMDRWSVDEMLAVKNRCYPTLSSKNFDQLLQWYGPIPRYVLEQTRIKPDVQWRDKMDEALSSTDINKSLLSVAASASSAAPDAVSHTVIHLRSSSPYLKRSYSLASAYVGDQLLDKAFKSGQLDFLAMVNGMASVGNSWHHMYGELFQLFVVKSLVDRPGSYDCRELGPGQSKTDPMQLAFAPEGFDDFDQLQPGTMSRLNHLYAQRIDVEPKLAAADAILTPRSVSENAYLIQITVGARKARLSQSGIDTVKSALTAMYERLAAATSEAATAAAWAAKDPSPVALYIVPSDNFDAFNADPTPGIRRLVVSFPVPRAEIQGTKRKRSSGD